MEPDQPAQPGRRSVLVRLGTAAGVAALTAQGGIVLRSLVANVSYDTPSRIKLGMPASFPDGLTLVPDARLFVSRRSKRFRVLSAVCTHLGCTVRAEALEQPQEAEIGGKQTRLTHKFGCPCHGSHYNGDGSNIDGPAPKPLAWFHLSVSPDDGNLIVDLAREVERDFRLTIA